MKERMLHKLKILAESAKYDVSCSSSGVARKNNGSGLGNASAWGVCHSFTEDGRCVSLLKVLMTNVCLYDCAYCINRRSNDIERVAFTPEELTELTLAFYRRNYIDGLFLSSGVLKSPDHTMERMLRVAQSLRNVHGFQGYIHMKAIPGASQSLIYQAGLVVDRLSINLEIPLEQDLKRLAPEKDHQSVYKPMGFIQQGISQSLEDRKKFRSAPRFAPAGQSTQMIVGAAGDCDRDILRLSTALYQRSGMKRVYYSGYIPVNVTDPRLPVTAVRENTLKRENRLYQADWLMRFYQFSAEEIVDSGQPNLELDMDPKLSWALRHPEFFPIDVNTADYAVLLRIPGVGVKSAKMIVAARRHGRLTINGLKKIGVVLKRAQYFIVNNELPRFTVQEAKPEYVRRALSEPVKSTSSSQQLSLGF
ncbi:putative DNA modification/repair radical SAM protein [Leminorella richardii]|uniref:Putative DNA modification/repair radical SAM protein n=1 Tax=Leminorella richardii TaxID=158841 RepID=A0A2X4UM17_9GAMM|nr:putative DNA modification/repair radical SAM protein [Leminorella richardii]SQI40927.1 putative DNA modification/repair radical SAM protein [Leminorella richardii]